MSRAIEQLGCDDVDSAGVGTSVNVGVKLDTAVRCNVRRRQRDIMAVEVRPRMQLRNNGAEEDLIGQDGERRARDAEPQRQLADRLGRKRSTEDPRCPRVALSKARRRDVTLIERPGAKAGGAAMQIKADTFAADLRPVLDELTDLSANAAAAELTRRGYPTPRGGKWTAGKIINVRARLV